MTARVASWASSEGNRRSMQANKGRDTKPELAVRRALHARGHRYRVDVRPERSLNRRADIVFTRAQVAVFIDGCYWHGCPDHYTAPATNRSFWADKVQANRARDTETTQALQTAGWHVIRAWEHEPADSVAEKVDAAVKVRRSSR